MHLRTIDLNLLTIFDAMYQEGNQRQAADKLGMSQPAVSNALSRLRAILGDPLFIRSGDGMHPTATAKRLSGPIHEALESIRSNIIETQIESEFDFATSNRTIVIVTEDIGELILLPSFVNLIAQIAPNVHIRTRRPYQGMSLSTKLSSGGVQLAIQNDAPEDPSLSSLKLLDDDLVTLVRRDHPRIRDAMTLDAFVSETHVVFGRRGHKGIRKSPIDVKLKELGLERRIAYEAFSSQSMPIVVSSSDLVCSVPRSIANVFASPLQLQIYSLPLDLKPISLHMVWSKTMERDVGHRWIRENLIQAAKNV